MKDIFPGRSFCRVEEPLASGEPIVHNPYFFTKAALFSATGLGTELKLQ